jgi:hypothetical protein
VREQRHRLRINELQNKIVGIPRDVLLILHVPALLDRGKRGAAETSGEDGECNERELHFAKCYRNWIADEAGVDGKEEKTSSSCIRLLTFSL